MTEDNGATRKEIWVAAFQDAGGKDAVYISKDPPGITMSLARATRYPSKEKALCALVLHPLPILFGGGAVEIDEE